MVVLNHSELKEVNFNLNIDPHGSVTFSLSPRNANVEFVGTDITYKPKMRIPIGSIPSGSAGQVMLHKNSDTK